MKKQELIEKIHLLENMFVMVAESDSISKKDNYAHEGLKIIDALFGEDSDNSDPQEEAEQLDLFNIINDGDAEDF